MLIKADDLPELVLIHFTRSRFFIFLFSNSLWMNFVEQVICICGPFFFTSGQKAKVLEKNAVLNMISVLWKTPMLVEHSIALKY